MASLRRGLGIVALALATSGAHAADKPRLMVLISVDQFRGDYITRAPHLLLPARDKGGVGGFRYLMERGAFYPNAQYTHYPLYTGPGHAVLSTGGTPSTMGIIGNNWYVPGTPRGRNVYCVEDADSPTVGAASGGVSPKNLRSTTIGDEMKMATGGRARVFTVSFKDRAAVLLAGRLSDVTLWFDNSTGGWVTSRHYRPDGTLPEWVAALNARKQADAYFGATWEPLLPQEIPTNSWMPVPDAVGANNNIGKAFPHRFTGGLTAPGPAFYGDLWNSPFASQIVMDTAVEGVRALGMGQDDVPDFLGINLAANDYVGHAFGPNSPEAFDITLRTDRMLSAFFRHLDATVPGGLKNVVIALSADHGVAPIPEAMHSVGFHAGRFSVNAMNQAIDDALDAEYGADDWVASNVEPAVWLNEAPIRQRKLDPRQVQRIAADALRRVEGIYDVFTKDQLMEGRTPDTAVARKVVTAFHPKLGGDLLVTPENLWFTGGGRTGTTHGSPWVYDTRVPVVIAGYGIRPGRYPRTASPQELAATFCALAGVNPPSGCTAPALVEALSQER